MLCCDNIKDWSVTSQKLTHFESVLIHIDIIKLMKLWINLPTDILTVEDKVHQMAGIPEQEQEQEQVVLETQIQFHLQTAEEDMQDMQTLEAGSHNYSEDNSSFFANQLANII